MDAEIESIGHQIQSILTRVCDCPEGLSEAQLDWRPPLDGANSIPVICAHTLGNARAFVLGIACGQSMGRDRPAEFRATGRDVAQLLESGKRLLQEIDAAMAALEPSTLNRRMVPPKELWGEGEPSEISVREALLHVVEHASIHLGELYLTRDWVRQAS